MSEAEFRRWMAYYQIEPFGEERADLRNALLCLTIAQVHGAKQAKKLKLSDFVLKFGPSEQQSVERMAMFLKARTPPKKKKPEGK
jgi:hypothetical protein